MSHLAKVTLHFFAAALITIGFGFGASLASNTILGGLAAVLVSLAVSAAAVSSAVFLTQQARATFKLMQTGRVVQYASFWICGLVALKIAALLFSAVLVVSNAALASLVATAICMASATLSGRIPWKGRTWLPVSLKSRK